MAFVPWRFGVFRCHETRFRCLVGRRQTPKALVELCVAPPPEFPERGRGRSDRSVLGFGCVLSG